MMPIGQFGTRLMGGKEAASPRYIFTNLSPLTRMIYNENDEPLLSYIEEEGIMIEPEYYVPVLPTILVNGAEGIGTGWSTYIPQFNPLDLIENIEAKLQNPSIQFKKMTPWYNGFLGEIIPQENGYLVKGVWKKIDSSSIRITELPLRRWTRDFKTMLEELMQEGEVLDIKEFHQDNTVDFHVKFKDNLSDIDVEKKLKLTASISYNNFVLFN